MSGTGLADMLAGLADSASAAGSSEPIDTDEPTQAEPESSDEEQEDATDESDDDEPGEEGDDESEEEAEPEPEKLKVKIKVDGEDLKLELTDEERDTLIQKGYAFDKKARELAKERKEVRALEKQVTDDKERVRDWLGGLQNESTLVTTLRKAGFPVDRAIEAAAVEMIQELQMSDEDRAQRQRARSQAEAEERERELAERERGLELQQEQEAWTRRLQKWVPKAMEQVGLPNEEKYLRLIGRELEPVLSNGRRFGFEDLVEAVEAVAEEWGPAPETEKPKGKSKKAKHPPAAPRSSAGGRRPRDRDKKRKSDRMDAGDYFTNKLRSL